MPPCRTPQGARKSSDIAAAPPDFSNPPSFRSYVSCSESDAPCVTCEARVDVGFRERYFRIVGRGYRRRSWQEENRGGGSTVLIGPRPQAIAWTNLSSGKPSPTHSRRFRKPDLHLPRRGILTDLEQLQRASIPQLSNLAEHFIRSGSDITQRRSRRVGYFLQLSTSRRTAEV